jgi:surfeit locus 1 family protein
VSGNAPFSAEGQNAPRSIATLAILGLAALAMTGGFLALGVWQVERLSWKRDLIERVDARIHAPATPAPGPADWPAITADRDAYRRVEAHGTLLNAQATFVQAATARGAGFWVMVPFRTDQGFTVLVNRGFVPPQARAPGGYATPSGPVTITGLLRITEPKGGFLRSNDPAANRWYSRDVGAIAASRELGPVAPYFIDAAASGDPNTLPVGGMTVIQFPNNHLSYALTWFVLAAMVTGGYLILLRWEWLLRRA